MAEAKMELAIDATELRAEINRLAEILKEYDIEHRIARLTMKPGDVLVVTVPDGRAFSRAFAERLRERVGDLFGPQQKVLLIDGGLELSVLTREELEKRMI